MKRFLFIPTCALVALGALTSCQKEEKTATELATELTSVLETVTSYKTAEAAAPKVEAINKRFQNASVRVFSMGGNALAGSDAAAYSDAVCDLARQIGRVRASKPVANAGGEIVDSLLVRTVGANSGAAADATPQEQVEAGAKYIYNADDQNANNPPNFAPCYGSSKLDAALSYVANIEEFTMTRFDKPEDCPEIPEAAAVEAEEEVTIPVPADDRKPAEEEPAEEESTDEASTDESGDDSSDETTDESTDDSSSDDADAGDSSEEPAADDSGDVSLDIDATDTETTDDSGDAAEEDTSSDDAAADESGEEEGGDDGMLDIEI